MSLDGGAYTSSSSPNYLLPSSISLGAHTLTGYVEDSAGQSSAVMTANETVMSPQVYVNNNSSGSIQLNWTGAPAPVVVAPYGYYNLAGPLSGLTVTLLTSGATYDLNINTDIAAVNAAAGVNDVNLSVSTSYPGLEVGAGNIGTITMPSGSTLNVQARHADCSTISPKACPRLG